LRLRWRFEDFGGPQKLAPTVYSIFSDFVTGVERFFLRKFEGGGWDSDMVGSFWMMSGMKSMNGIIALLLSLG